MIFIYIKEHVKLKSSNNDDFSEVIMNTTMKIRAISNQKNIKTTKRTKLLQKSDGMVTYLRILLWVCLVPDHHGGNHKAQSYTKLVSKHADRGRCTDLKRRN